MVLPVAAMTAGSIAGLAGGCWIAREVFGEQNPRWKLFRTWLYSSSPVWFFKLYIRYGERIAHFIRNKPFLKNRIRNLMNLVISQH